MNDPFQASAKRNASASQAMLTRSGKPMPIARGPAPSMKLR
jgi:hypothetical protein